MHESGELRIVKTYWYMSEFFILRSFFNIFSSKWLPIFVSSTSIVFSIYSQRLVAASDVDIMFGISSREMNENSSTFILLGIWMRHTVWMGYICCFNNLGFRWPHLQRYLTKDELSLPFFGYFRCWTNPKFFISETHRCYSQIKLYAHLLTWAISSGHMNHHRQQNCFCTDPKAVYGAPIFNNLTLLLQDKVFKQKLFYPVRKALLVVFKINISWK